MKIQVIETNGVKLAIEQFGRDQDDAVLLMMGNSAPGLVWPDAFCHKLAEAGLRVIRFDQRDTGLSTYLDFAATPYSLHDLVADVFGLLDGLGIEAAHLVGLSQGGNIAYLAGLSQPDRVKSITSIMSSPDMGPKNDAFAGKPPKSGELPRPAPDYVNAVIALNSTPASSEDEIAERFMENFRLAAGPKSPFDRDFWLEMGHAVATRQHKDQQAAFANHSNHTKAQAATAPLTSQDLGSLAQPCLIIHGDMDPIFPLAHAEWAASRLRNARLRTIPDMGHALDPFFIQPMLYEIQAFLEEVKRRGRQPRADC